jgi:transposase
MCRKVILTQADAGNDRRLEGDIVRMTTVADVVDAVIGVDTHTDTHTLVMTGPSGAVLGELEVANTATGSVDALAWVAGAAPGPQLIFAVEGTRSHGIGLARSLITLGMRVVEIERPRRTDSTRTGKSDRLDARAAAHACLRLEVDKLPVPRADGDREALRILLAARADLTYDKTAKTNRLRALLLTGTDADRALLQRHRAFTRTDLTAISTRRGHHHDTLDLTTRRAEARRLAHAILATDQELKANKKQLTNLIHHLAPGLLDHTGIGPVSASQAIVAYSHHGRCRSEAAYASLAAANPIPASSGRTTRHRLNPGGDRQLNRALHDIARTRMRCCPHTRAYVERRRAQGLTTREIRRCLKRYIARQLYRYLRKQPTLAT